MSRPSDPQDSGGAAGGEARCVAAPPSDRQEGGNQAPAHGTYAMYADYGCRCDECRGYQNARVRRNRAARLAAGRINHGTRSAYDAGCRCDSCFAARVRAYPGDSYARWLHTRKAKR